VTWRVLEGDCVDVLRGMEDASVDAIVTDPPYGLGFMGQTWDRPWAVTAEARVGFEGREGNLTLPSHRDNRNANCRRCGGRQRGANRCRCETPLWDRVPAQDMRDFQAWCEVWAREALRVLKPGGHLLAFGGTRTYHRLACALEDAGFEIRDCLAWIYGSGFPKSLDVSKAIDRHFGAEREIVGEQPDRWTQKGSVLFATGQPRETVPITGAPATPEAAQWQGWGTALKPAHEPVVVARKPLAGSVAENVLEHGTGALNIDACRLEPGEGGSRDGEASADRTYDGIGGDQKFAMKPGVRGGAAEGRWPANVALDPESAAMLDEQSGTLTSGGGPLNRNADKFRTTYGEFKGGDEPADALYGDTGGASRFFYCAKASTAERNAGLDDFPLRERPAWSSGTQNPGSFQEGNTGPTRNIHPTVKPIGLMRWLVRLVTPPGGLVLDPFAGSGTTGIAAVLEGFEFVGVERDPEYARIARARVGWWAQHPEGVSVEAALAAHRQRRAAAEAGQLDLLADAAA